jgi:hypothetical protein
VNGLEVHGKLEKDIITLILKVSNNLFSLVNYLFCALTCELLSSFQYAGPWTQSDQHWHDSNFSFCAHIEAGLKVQGTKFEGNEKNTMKKKREDEWVNIK